MSEIRVHIERLVLDGIDVSRVEASAIQAALSATVERMLLSSLGERRDADYASSAHATLRAPMVATTTDRATFGESAGQALASTIAPLCGGGATDSRGSSRG